MAVNAGFANYVACVFGDTAATGGSRFAEAGGWTDSWGIWGFMSAAANSAITLTFFAMFGSMFLMTQYWQFVKGYEPLAVGVRLIPYAAAAGNERPPGTRSTVLSHRSSGIELAASLGDAWAEAGAAMGTDARAIAASGVEAGAGGGLVDRSIGLAGVVVEINDATGANGKPAFIGGHV